jgi:hypothetical protein
MQKATPPVLMQSYTTINGLAERPEETINQLNRNSNAALRKSHVYRHNIHLIKRFRAVGALPHAVGDTVIHAVVAEYMPTGLQCSILKVLSANGA